MSYTPINWQTGQTITAEKLNKMDNGWSVTSGTTTICDETITSVDDGGIYVAQLSASSITSDAIIVTYDGSTYQCAKDGDNGYGDSTDFTFTTYPFRIERDGFIITETAGTHTVKIEAVESTVEISADYAAVVSATSQFLRVVQHVTTWQQAHDALVSGKIVYFVYEVDETKCNFYIAGMAEYDSGQDMYIVSFDDGHFTMGADSPNGALFGI